MKSRKYSREYVEELLGLYREIKMEIEERLEGFKRLWREGSETDLFSELIFCLLTPQSKARVCWNAVVSMGRSRVLTEGSYDDLLPHLYGVRFKYTKARRLVEVRWILNVPGGVRGFLTAYDSPMEMRDALVEKVKGYGMKEASHFLRNVGLGEDLAILDRHILKNLKEAGVIGDIPGSLTRARYLDIEEAMAEFSRTVDIPLSHLDLLLWYRETGEVFK